MSYPNLSKYLSTYAEPEAQSFPSHLLADHSFDFGLTLPLRGEDPHEIEQRLVSLRELLGQHGKRVIVVAVINGAGTKQSEYEKANQDLISFLDSQSPEWNDSFFLQNQSPFLSVLWVDRAIRRPFGDKQGVGLARKIGCDLLIRFRYQNKLRSPWLFTTDADASLPEDYFNIPHSSATAFHFPYRHDAKGFEGKEALTLYEIHLRYYFLGLLWANSPYAYPTIGSCLAINADSYVQVRGFQDRQAGEDFHLLNKLRKLGPLEYRHSYPITLRGRFSQRVPFGTGQSTIEIHEQLNREVPFTLYPPAAFSFLKSFLSQMTDALSQDSTKGLSQVTDYFSTLSAYHPTLFECLQTLQVPKIVKEAFQSRPKPEPRIRHFHTSFDALKTLRLIHLLEERSFPRLPWTEALQGAIFCDFSDEIQTPDKALASLQALEEKSLGTLFNCDRSF